MALKRMVWFLRGMGLIYALLALFYFFFSSEFFYLINAGPRFFKFTEAIPESTEKFWLTMTLSMLAMLSAISFLGAESPKTRGYTLTHLLSKTVSTVCFFYFFFNEHRYFAYLVGMVSDFIIALILLWFLIRTARAKS